MSDFIEQTKERTWLLKDDGSPEIIAAERNIADRLGVNPILAKLLYTRGYPDAESAKRFLFMESEMLCRPFTMKDMDRAIARIRTAVGNHEKITIYGDYDVDGVTAVCTLYLYLKSVGANVDYYIPNRIGEGYGVSVQAIDTIRESGTTLIVTVDTGITATEEVAYAASFGIDFVITDHHECKTELPAACAMVNPHRPDCPYEFKELAGVGVVFKVICAYEERLTGQAIEEITSRLFARYADLVAIGTIADVMPIAGENRLIVSYGLHMMQNSQRVGLNALIDASSADGRFEKKRKRVKITSGFIGYTLAPRINAAGRIRSASTAVELFLSENYDEAYRIATELCNANKERQNEENKIVQEAYAMIDERGYGDRSVIVLDGDHWHHGVIGIVASRITEKYYRPSILVSFEGGMANDQPSPEDIGKGSGRSVKGLNLVDALCACSEHLAKFGGHELAAGLSVTRAELPAFREKINAFADQILAECDLTPTLEADCEIAFSDITLELADALGILEPYGTGNPTPAFILRDIALSEIVSVGDGKHTKLTLTDGENYVTAMCFSASPSSLEVSVGDTVDLLFNIDVNEWLGRRTVQLIVKDIRFSEKRRLAQLAERERFEEIWNGAAFSPGEDILPSHDDFAAVYRLIAAAVRSGTDTLSHREILSRLSCLKAPNALSVNYIKLKIIFKIFREMNILCIEEPEDEVYHFRVQYSSGKTDLEKSGLLRRLRSQQKSD